MWPSGNTGPTTPTVAGILVIEGVGVPGHTEAARESVQRAAVAATATTAGVSLGEHDDIIYDAKPYGTSVYGAVDYDARAHTDAYDASVASAAAADDGTTTADDGTNDTIVSNGTAAAIGRSETGPATPLCLIRNTIISGEELLTVRGGQPGSFKQ